MKTNLDLFYKSDQDLEKNGVWFDVQDKSGPAFLVRPFKASNPRIKAAMAKYYKPFARQIENDQLSLEKQREININLFLDVCLVEWKNVQIDGEEVVYSREAAFKLFTELPELFDTLFRYAQDFKSYKADLGNS